MGKSPCDTVRLHDIKAFGVVLQDPLANLFPHLMPMEAAIL